MNSAVPSPITSQRTVLGHPVGLFLLFLVEMWERFSYYGMRGLLVLYLATPVTGMLVLPDGAAPGFNPGRGWSDGDAATLYGWYTGLAYLVPIIGGLIGDKLIGTHRSMVVGGLLISAGHVVLAVSGFGAMAENQLGMSIFMFGLALIVLGTGHFKPSVSVMVGELYPPGDPRRDGAFSIFYMGINLGAFLCAFVCGTLGETVGWHWGFGSAAVGMLAGLGLYLYSRPKYLAHVGLPPAGKPNYVGHFLAGGTVLAAGFAVLSHLGVAAQVNALMTPVVTGLIGLVVLGLSGWFVAIQEKQDRGPVASIFIFMLFNAFFWIAFEQAGSSINLFTDRYTDRHIGSFNVPTTWFQSINPGIIILLAPAFGAIWTSLARRGMNPTQPMKIALGLAFLGAGYVIITAAGAASLPGHAPASLWLVFATYTLHTFGELCLSPTGLSYVTKAAPVRFVSLLMGIWFISSFIANLGGGLIASRVEAIEKGDIQLPWRFGGQADFFFLFVVSSFGAAAVIVALTPLLKKLMRSVDD